MPSRTSPEARTLARRARLSLGHARPFLLRPRPESLDAAVPHLDEASRSLQKLEKVLAAGAPAGGADLAPELAALRREIALLTALLENAAVFHFGWAQVLAAAAAGYNASGEPGSAPPLRSLAVEG